MDFHLAIERLNPTDELITSAIRARYPELEWLFDELDQYREDIRDQALIPNAEFED